MYQFFLPWQLKMFKACTIQFRVIGKPRQCAIMSESTISWKKNQPTSLLCSLFCLFVTLSNSIKHYLTWYLGSCEITSPGPSLAKRTLSYIRTISVDYKWRCIVESLFLLIQYHVTVIGCLLFLSIYTLSWNQKICCRFYWWNILRSGIISRQDLSHLSSDSWVSLQFHSFIQLFQIERLDYQFNEQHLCMLASNDWLPAQMSMSVLFVSAWHC